MTQAQGPGAYVYQGLWTNWSKGSVRGLTLTLSSGNGNLLIAVLALFVALAGGQLWTVIRFFLHQRHPPDALGNSLRGAEQIVLRNTTTDINTAQELLRLLRTPRYKKTKSFTGIIGVILLATAHLTFFVVAGTFSSNLTDAGQTVLSRSPYCGGFAGPYVSASQNDLNTTTVESYALSVQMIEQREHDLALSQEYANECYMSQPAYYMSSNCNTFQKPRLNYTVSYDAPCPFDARVCLPGTKAISFDTGLLDSRSDFGINSNDESQIYYRKITQCAVLNDPVYTSGWVNESLDVQSAYAYYGPAADGYNTSYTYQTSNFASFYTKEERQDIIQYQLVPVQWVHNLTDISDFAPIPGLIPKDADLTLVFMSYSGQ